MKKVFALIDCNNFFASCEKSFNPKLKNKPVLVLSNNDGCVVARSKEAKKLGIPMGIPYFKIKNDILRYDIEVFSSNYELYGDMSRRIMSIIKQEFPIVEIYSIDEAFVDLSHEANKNFTTRLKNLREKILMSTGIHVSVGIARTKVLAKIANELAKKNEMWQGVCNLLELNESNINDILNKFPVNDVWGCGKNYSLWLKQHGVFSALQLKNFEKFLFRKQFGITAERIILELNNISCLDIQTEFVAKKSIVSSRSFAKDIEQKSDLIKAISYHASVVAQKLRCQNSKAHLWGVFLMQNRFKYEQSNSITNFVTRSEMTSFTPTVVSLCCKLLNQCFVNGYSYKKCGVYASEIVSDEPAQLSLFDEDHNAKKRSALMKGFDEINKKWGKGSIKMASEEFDKSWYMSQKMKSPCYTTSWDELLEVS
jgi:DNA polymerase V